MTAVNPAADGFTQAIHDALALQPSAAAMERRAARRRAVRRWLRRLFPNLIVSS